MRTLDEFILSQEDAKKIVEKIDNAIMEKFSELETKAIEEDIRSCDFSLDLKIDEEMSFLFEGYATFTFEHCIGGEYGGWKERWDEATIDDVEINLFTITLNGEPMEIFTDIVYNELKKRKTLWWDLNTN